MRQLLAHKPWLWIVGGLTLFVMLDLLFLWICLAHPVQPAVVP